MEGDAKFEEKLALGFKHDTTNLVNFNAGSDKFENLHTLKIKDSLFVWKMTWEIWWILTWAVKNLKIYTLMGYFCQMCVITELK